MNETSAHVDPSVDEFKLAGPSPRCPSVHVKAPRIQEAPVSLECRFLTRLRLPSDHPKVENNLVIGQVVGTHIDDRIIRDGMVDMAAYRPIARLGYMDYTLGRDRVRDAATGLTALLLTDDLTACALRSLPVWRAGRSPVRQPLHARSDEQRRLRESPRLPMCPLVRECRSRMSGAARTRSRAGSSSPSLLRTIPMPRRGRTSIPAVTPPCSVITLPSTITCSPTDSHPKAASIGPTHISVRGGRTFQMRSSPTAPSTRAPVQTDRDVDGRRTLAKL